MWRLWVPALVQGGRNQAGTDAKVHVFVTEGKICCISCGCEGTESPVLGRTHTENISSEHHNEITGATCPVFPDLQPSATQGCPWSPWRSLLLCLWRRQGMGFWRPNLTSSMWLLKMRSVCASSFSCVQLLAIPWTLAL